MPTILNMVSEADLKEFFDILSSKEPFYLSNSKNYKQKIEEFACKYFDSIDKNFIQEIIQLCLNNIQQYQCLQLNLYCLYRLSLTYETLTSYFSLEQLANISFLPPYQHLLKEIFINPTNLVNNIYARKYLTIMFPNDDSIFQTAGEYHIWLMDDIEEECKNIRPFRENKSGDMVRKEDFIHYENEGMKNKFTTLLKILYPDNLINIPLLKDYYFEIKEIIKIFWLRISHKRWFKSDYTIETNAIKLLNNIFMKVIALYSGIKDIEEQYLTLAKQYYSLQQVFVEIRDKAINLCYTTNMNSHNHSNSSLNTLPTMTNTHLMIDKEGFFWLEDCYSTSKQQYANNLIGFIYQYIFGQELQAIFTTTLNQMKTPTNFLYEIFKSQQLNKDKKMFSTKQLQAIEEFLSLFYNQSSTLIQENQKIFEQYFLTQFAFTFNMHELTAKGFVNDDTLSNQESMLTPITSLLSFSLIPGGKQIGDGIRQISRRVSKAYNRKSFEQLNNHLNFHELQTKYLPVVIQRILLTDAEFIYFTMNIYLEKHREHALREYANQYVKNLYSSLADLQNKNDLELFHNLSEEHKIDYLYTITMTQQTMSIETYLLKANI